MSRFTFLFLTGIILVSSHLNSDASSKDWITDFEKAKEIAEKEGKAMLINFNGSDWCGVCVKLDKEIFQKEEFKTGVTDILVPVNIDLPQDTSKMSAETIKQNEALQETFFVSAFPTIFLADAKGRPFARTGYLPVSASDYVKNLTELLVILQKRDLAFGKAAKLKGDERLLALIEGLKSLQIDAVKIIKFYDEELSELKKSDSKSAVDFVKGLDTAMKYEDFKTILDGYIRSGDVQSGISYIDFILEKKVFDGELNQHIAVLKGILLAESGNFEGSILALDVAKAMNPESEIGIQVDGLKQQVEQFKAGVPAKK